MMDDLILKLDSSDDDVPEEVTFEASKASALRSMKEAMEATRREKELLKERRRKRQQIFVEQKKQRLLPAELLEEMDTIPSQTHKPPEDLEEKQKDTEEDDDGDESGSEEEEIEIKGNVRNLKDGYTVMRPKKLVSSQQQVALDFLQSRFNGPGIKRTTSNQLLSLNNKRGLKQSAAVQFVRRDWGAKYKANAEKLKRRWLHKQQVSP